MIVKPIQYFGRLAVVGCDNNCRKAWGSQRRPRIYFDRLGNIVSVFLDRPGEKRIVSDPEGDGYDNYAYIPDQLLDEAPQFPGTWEGGDGKPGVDEPATEDKINKWCTRECERSEMTECGKPEGPLELRDYSEFRFNMPSIKRIVEAKPGWKAELIRACHAALTNRSNSM